MQLAVGLILAPYFGAIVKFLVHDIIVPPIGLLLGGIDLMQLKYVPTAEAAETTEEQAMILPKWPSRMEHSSTLS